MIVYLCKLTCVWFLFIYSLVVGQSFRGCCVSRALSIVLIDDNLTPSNNSAER